MELGNKDKIDVYNLTSRVGIREIFNALDNDKSSVRFIGGCVRDSLIGKSITDIDIATIFTPEEVMAKLNSVGIKTIPTGIKFGTVTAVIDKNHYEITTLRKDIECDGRHAKVSFTNNWFEDAERRDFTINALSCSYEGELFDYFNGISDLENNIVCFIGNPEQRIKEDYLRILRFFRFSTYYSNNFDEQALLAITKLAPKLINISGERIQTEMFKMLVSDKITTTIKVMSEIGLLPYIGIDKTGINLLANLIKAEYQLDQTPNIILRLFILGHYDLVKLVKNWKLSNKIKNELYFLKDVNLSFNPNISKKEAKNILFSIGKEKFIKLAILGLAQNPLYLELYQDLITMAQIPIPTFPITGDDLLSINIQSGKKLGEFLSQAKEYWVKSEYLADKNEILNYIKKII